MSEVEIVTLHESGAGHLFIVESGPRVRAEALHVAEDAREIEALEALQAWLAEHDEGREEAAQWPQRRGRRRHTQDTLTMPGQAVARPPLRPAPLPA